jgi:hypothetical protein
VAAAVAGPSGWEPQGGRCRLQRRRPPLARALRHLPPGPWTLQLAHAGPPPQALTPRGKKFEPRPAPATEATWIAAALAVYRDYASPGQKPALRVLNKALECLRVPWFRRTESGGRGGEAGVEAAPAPQVQAKIGLESVYHVQAISIMEQAIIR